MNITYIFHSGFLLETESCYCIFDYYRGALPKLDPSKSVLVFASHCHADHYNPEIFALLAEQGMQQVTAVLSEDIPTKRWPEGIPTIKVTSHQTYELPCGVRAQTLLSTDSGVAFLVECDGYVIFHAGDLNDWSWDAASEYYSEQNNRQMAGSYRHEIILLQKWLDGRTLDAAFLPLDPRQGAMYNRGMLYFLKKIPVKAVYPMHYWEQPEIIQKFLQENPVYKNIMIAAEPFC